MVKRKGVITLPFFFNLNELELFYFPSCLLLLKNYMQVKTEVWNFSGMF